MSTDLRERQGTAAAGRGGVVLQPTKHTRMWPFVVAATVVAVLLVVSAAMLTQSTRPDSFPDLNTEIREGSGYAQDGRAGSFPDLNTEIREGSGYSDESLGAGAELRALIYWHVSHLTRHGGDVRRAFPAFRQVMEVDNAKDR